MHHHLVEALQEVLGETPAAPGGLLDFLRRRFCCFCSFFLLDKRRGEKMEERPRGVAEVGARKVLVLGRQDLIFAEAPVGRTLLNRLQ